MAPDKNSMESRLADVEEELRRIKQLLAVQGGTPWWKQMVGSHENDPVFAEIVRLGRAIRQGRRRGGKNRPASSKRVRKGADRE
jgi:hypothetical protein